MLRNFVLLGLMVFLGGRIVRSMPDTMSDKIMGNLTVSENRLKMENESTDATIQKVLDDVTNRLFPPDDSHMISLIKKGIIEAARSKPSAPIEAGAKKAQKYVTFVTAAYTQAIFRANSAQQAQEILLRFQDTIKRIVDFAKNGEFTS